MRLAIASCKLIAQRTASAALLNSTNTPSPTNLTSRPMVFRDGRVDKFLAMRPDLRQRAFLVCFHKPTVADHIGSEYDCETTLHP
jgi:hypothetical protein